MNRRRGVSALPTLAVVAALAGLFALQSPTVEANTFHLACPDTIEEGEDAAMQVTFHGGGGITEWAVSWNTETGTAVEADYYPHNNTFQQSSAHEKRVGRMRMGIRTKEDDLVEEDETFVVEVNPSYSARDLSCTITIKDDDAPRVTDMAITSRPRDGVAYRIGEVVEIDVTFDHPVRTAGEPFVRLRFGPEGDPGDPDSWENDPTERIARYRSGSGADTLSFYYIVWEGDEDANGITIVSSGRNGMGEGAIKYLSEDLDVDAFHEYEGQSNISSTRQRVDGSPPQVAYVEIVSRPNDGATYRAGERIEVQVAFSHPVQVLGDPAVKLRLGRRGDSPADRTIIALPPGDLGLREAAYTEGAPHDTILDFEYVVQPADSDINGVTIVGSGATGLGEGAIAFQRFDYTDGRYAGISFPEELVPADHSYPRQDNLSGHLVDGRPYVTDVSMVSTPTDGTAYRTGETIKIRVTFNDPVQVPHSGAVYLGLELDGPDGPEYRDVRYVQVGRGKSATKLLFEYEVQEGDQDGDGVTILSSEDTGLSGVNTIAAPGGDSGEEIYAKISYAAQEDLAEHRIWTDESSPLPGLPSPPEEVDEPPAITSVRITSLPRRDDTYRTGEGIHIRVAFSEDVTVGGAPQLELDFDGEARMADYRRTDGSVVFFKYEITAGDTDADGVAINANVLSPNGGSIQDDGGNDADLAHDAVAADPGHKVAGHGGL